MALSIAIKNSTGSSCGTHRPTSSAPAATSFGTPLTWRSLRTPPPSSQPAGGRAPKGRGVGGRVLAVGRDFDGDGRFHGDVLSGGGSPHSPKLRHRHQRNGLHPAVLIRN